MAQPVRYRKKMWKEISCYACGGHGQVSGYTMDGSDFTGAEECDLCNGSGLVFISKGGAIAQYPGGPFIGRLTKQEMTQQILSR
jgi:hypothetical protein